MITLKHVHYSCALELIIGEAHVDKCELKEWVDRLLVTISKTSSNVLLVRVIEISFVQGLLISHLI